MSERSRWWARRTFTLTLLKRLAQGSLWPLIALMPAGCLVASTPEFEEPQRTRPFLIPAEADPDIREFVPVINDDVRKDFSAMLVSEDVGQPVKIALYIDYGEPNVAGQPFRNLIQSFPDIPAGRMSDGPRQVSAQWHPLIIPVTNGCHTVTMIVSHEFDYLGCPKSLADSSQLTWTILRCPSTAECEPIDYNDSMKDCPSSNSSMNQLASCPDESKGPDAGDGGGS